MTKRTGRRTHLAIAADARAAEIRRTIGQEIRRSRRARHWSQGDLAERAGMTRYRVGRIERADHDVGLEDLARAAEAVARPLVLSLRRDSSTAVADASHLAMQELVLRTARQAGFDGTFELPVGPEPWRSIDVGLSSSRLRTCLAVECWNAPGDIGAAARSSNRKLAEMSAMAVSRWGADGRGGVVWVVRATAANRALLARYPEVFARRFSGSSARWLATLAAGMPPPAEPGLVWCDVATTRLFAWRQSAGGRR